MKIKNIVLVSLTTTTLAAHGRGNMNFDNTVPSGNFVAWSNPCIESGCSFTAQNPGNIDFMDRTSYGFPWSYNKYGLRVHSPGRVSISICLQSPVARV